MESIFMGLSCFLFGGCATTEPAPQPAPLPPLTMNENYETATFAGGCFWCMEPAYQEHPGVIDAVVGYAGGQPSDANYVAVSKGDTDHREAVQVTYDPKEITYNELVDIFWRQIDPTDAGGQFADRGTHYTTAIYYHDAVQEATAQMSKTALNESGKFEEPVATLILPYNTFFLAEGYHQDYYKKASDHYERYKKGSGRADFIQENWARDAALEAALEDQKQEEAEYQKPTDLSNLDPLSYHVVVEGGTESPFENAYWDNKADGIYVDKVTGDPLFSSTHKYDSGTGWPSFHTTINEDKVTMHEDNKLAVPRVEIRGEGGHLGHVFNDGPEDKGGQRFCTNSASLTFIPKEDMKAQGYEEYLYLFEEDVKS